ncbi:hypothetical protein V8E55_009398 [Tylopilus felleus]
MRRVALAGFFGTYLLTGAFSQTWYGKHYKVGQSVIFPGGNFPLPSDPLLAFRCAPAILPYLAEDVQSIIGINQGALGVVPWSDPAPADTKTSAFVVRAELAQDHRTSLLNTALVRTAYVVGGVSVATWKTGGQTLVLATNTNYVNQTVSWKALGLKGAGATTMFVSPWRSW